MTKININKMSELLPQFKTELSFIHKMAMTQFASIVDKHIKDNLKRTLNYREQSGKYTFRGAEPFSKYEIKTTINGSVLTYNIFMHHSSTRKPHELWHIVNKGRRTGQAKSRIRFPVRNSTRTTPSNFEVETFKGWSGEWRSVAKGNTIKGFEGRKWYATARKDLEKFMKKREYKVIGLVRIEHSN